MFIENEVDINVLLAALSERNVNYSDGTAYIMPESSIEGVDLLNEYAPDLRKDFRDMGIESIVVRGEKHNYLALRSADIILPLIFGIPFAIFANFITKWIDSYLGNEKVVRVKYVKQEGDKHKEIVIEGTGEEVKEILDSLKDH
ncbi:hypothetical protein WOC08_23655 [Vibrio parahaemolyticus]|nr:hypothetical protein [Vibrio parahaemolyticus]HCE2594381.1 hypothetical protein [Vibrio parahaemolyticus]HCE3428492.1 hypothetical protein [Vibrio parahaemolyticus]HCG9220586.1 hypothetical protein [Vibrio parahaemolyticus]